MLDSPKGDGPTPTRPSSDIAGSFQAARALVAENPFAFVLSAFLHSAGRLIKAGVFGLLITLVLSRFVPGLGLPVIGADPSLTGVLALGALLALLYPFIMASEYLARRTMLGAERRHMEAIGARGQKVGLFWSTAAMISSVMSAVLFFIACLLLAPIPTLTVAVIGLAGHGLLRPHLLLAGRSGPERTRAVFEGIGRVNLTGEIVAGISFLAIFALAIYDIGFPEDFAAWAVIYLFLARFMLSNMQMANVSLQRIVSIAAGAHVPNQFDEG